MRVEVAFLISLVSVAFSVYFGLKNSKRSDEKEIEARVANDTRINVKLDDIGMNVKDIKGDLVSVKKDIQSIDKRLIIVEQSTKSAHHRIDEMTGQHERKEVE